MRILFILENFYPRIGGVETLFLNLVEYLDDIGYHVTVFTNQYDPFLPKTEKIGKQGQIIRKRYFNRYIFTFGAWWHAIGLARKADIIHTTSFNAAVPARLAAKMTKTPVVITFHERWGELWDRLPWMSSISRKLHRAFEAWICGFRFDRFIAVSEYTKESLIEGGVDPALVQRIYNGISYDHFPEYRGSEDSTYTFLYYGRLGYAKGVDLLLQAYHNLKKFRDDHRLLMVIPSEKQPTTEPINQLLEDLGLQDEIEFKHDLSYVDLIDQIARVDAVVIPSYSEGFCFAAAETVAIGTPIITTGQGALKEVVSGKHIICEEHTASAITTAMHDALENEWQGSEVKKFELIDSLKSYKQLYRDILKEALPK